MFNTTERVSNQHRLVRALHERYAQANRQLFETQPAISIELLLLEFHRRLKEELQDARAKKDKPREREVILLGAFSTIGFAAGLRGEEIVLTNLGGLRRYWKEAMTHSTPHVPLALRGRFKGELREQWHYMPLALTSASGIEIEFWISTMVIWYEQQGITSGRAFVDTEGSRVRARHFARAVYLRFLSIQRDRPDLIDPSVDVFEEFGMSRSWRRGSDSQALSQGIPTDDINRNNRWRSKEAASKVMINHYADAKLIVRRLLQ
jgi:hypothetical protein